MRIYYFLFALPSLWATEYDFLIDVPGDAFSDVGGIFSAGHGDLRGCINQANFINGSNTFIFDFDSSISSITLENLLPILVANVYFIDGSGGVGGRVTIDGDSQYPGIIAFHAQTILANLTIQNCISQGGNGSGGGMGAGGAVFAVGSEVILDNVTIDGCSAIGGDGAFGRSSSYGGGGGGLF